MPAPLALAALPLSLALRLPLPRLGPFEGWTAVGFAVVTAVVLAWNIVYAGRIARLRRAPRPLATLSGACGLLVAPALVAHLAASSLYGGRAVGGIAWLWPLTTTLFLAQAAYATTRRFVTPLLGVPLLAYDLLVCAAAWTRYAVDVDGRAPTALLALTAAQAALVGTALGPAALASPFAVQLPLVVPAYPARWRLTRSARALLALAATFAAGALLLELPRGVGAVRSYAPWAAERLSERPRGDFVLGAKLLNTLAGPPTSLSTRWDLPLLDSLGTVGAVSVALRPGALTLLALDSLRRVLDAARADSTLLVVELRYDPDDGTRRRADPAAFDRRRLAMVERAARALRPDILLPAGAPYGATADALGRLPPETWQTWLAAAARRAHAINRNIRVGVAAAAYDAADSTLYAWAASGRSPLDVVGFTVRPGFGGGEGVDARLRAADRWMRATARATAASSPGAAGAPRPRTKPHWLFDVHAFPAVHGDESQERTIWHALAWATANPAVTGVIVSEPGDYATMTGLRAASGRLRGATGALARAARGLQETVVP